MRKPVAALVLLIYMVAYVVLIGTVASLIAGWPRWAMLVFFVVAGIGWIFPLKPLFAWMHRGTKPGEDE